MKFHIHRMASESLRHLIDAYNEFNFVNGSYTGHGKIIRQSSGACKYAQISICIEVAPQCVGIFEWKVTDNQIPIYFLDDILTPIKTICSERSMSDLKVSIVDGANHVVDSNSVSFQIATVRAMADLIGIEVPDNRYY